MNNLQPVDAVVIENLLIGACPERELEMRQAWKVLQPRFYIRADGDGHGLSARGNQISWMHKTWAMDWAIAALGMHVVTAYQPHIFVALVFNVPITSEALAEDTVVSLVQTKMDDVIYFVRSVQKSGNPDEDWPAIIPPPGTCPDPSIDPNGKAIFDLACLAAAASMFHELRHVQFSREGDAPPLGADEERACDEYARLMLLEKVDEYCAATGEPYLKVLDKRIMGLATAALCMAYEEQVGMQAAIENSHPPARERFEILLRDTGANEHALSWEYVSCLLIHFLRSQNRLPDVLSFSSAKDLATQLIALL
jgi:hypothetical protein